MLIISDLHICNGDSLGTFGWDQGEFIARIEVVRAIYGIDQIVLNGDIYELCKYTDAQIRGKNGELLDYLEGPGSVYIRGNHDILSPRGRPHYQIVNSKGKSIHIEHGHCADYINGTGIGRVGGKLFFKILKLAAAHPCFYSLYFAFLEKDEEIKEIRKHNSYKYLRYALNLLKKHDLVVLGHTHKMEVHKTYYLQEKKYYLNCGTCSLGRFQAVILDTETFWYETIKQKEHQTFALPNPAASTLSYRFETRSSLDASALERHDVFSEESVFFGN